MGSYPLQINSQPTHARNISYTSLDVVGTLDIIVRIKIFDFILSIISSTAINHILQDSFLVNIESIESNSCQHVHKENNRMSSMSYHVFVSNAESGKSTLCQSVLVTESILARTALSGSVAQVIAFVIFKIMGQYMHCKIYCLFSRLG